MRLRDLQARLAPGFRIGDHNDCWEWSGTSVRSGYGRARYQGRNQLVHRLTYEAIYGAIPDGCEVDHLCFNPRCVNPAHLEAVTPAENMRRRAARVTHCPNGHPYDAENTIVFRGSRRCRACRLERDRAKRAIAAADRPAPQPKAERPPHLCPDCHQPIASDRRYCDRDRDRRRALTFLRQAWVILKHSEGLPAVVSARDHVVDAIEELTR